MSTNEDDEQPTGDEEAAEVQCREAKARAAKLRRRAAMRSKWRRGGVPSGGRIA